MTTKKAAKKAAKKIVEKAAPKRRAPRKEPPITETEVLFCHLVMKGIGNPNATQLERIESAGAKVGFDKTLASRVYHRKPVQAWIASYRDRMMTEMVREEVRVMKRAGFTREDILTLLHDLATIPPEKTKGSIAGQVEAVAEMAKVMGIQVAPRDPDAFFKGRTEAEIACYAEHGVFTMPVVQ
ncbi:MAG TPA: hypothetical protein VGU67_02890 [Edaphobacter sp.]|nr:hypothetical protein [Edaphobacter sp.]